MSKLRLVLVGTISIAALAACGNGSTASSSSSSSSSSACTGCTSGKALGTAAVKIQATDQLKFAPDTTTVPNGQIVEWDNTGQIAHTVTFDGDSDNKISQPALSGGDKWQVKFTAAGTYHYVCTIHAGMEGTITVS